MLEKTLYANRLFDFYGPLLTENQRNMFRLYYQRDLSYSEVANEKGCSRQAVHDVVDRALSRLRNWEKKLSLVETFEKRQEYLRELKGCIERNDHSEAKQIISILMRDRFRESHSNDGE